MQLAGPVRLSAGGDAGAGASDLTWQAAATLDLRLGERWTLRAGYRHLDVDYEHDGFVWDVEMSGPILGVGVRF